MLRIVNKALNRFHLEVRSTDEVIPADIAADAHFMRIYHKCRPFTMTTVERMYTLYEGVKYMVQQQIPGDVVECGVWKGGSSMVVAETLLELGVTDRKLYMYDTYEGMNEPTEADVAITGEQADILLQQQDKNAVNSIWCYSALEEVKANMALTGYPADNIVYVKGKVEETIPGTIPSEVGLLRLDTDWYESTKHELVHLYPLLSSRGLLIIDDFGFWEGAKKAVLEYFTAVHPAPFISRIDMTGRLVIKQ